MTLDDREEKFYMGNNEYECREEELLNVSGSDVLVCDWSELQSFSLADNCSPKGLNQHLLNVTMKRSNSDLWGWRSCRNLRCRHFASLHLLGLMTSRFLRSDNFPDYSHESNQSNGSAQHWKLLIWCSAITWTRTILSMLMLLFSGLLENHSQSLWWKLEAEMRPMCSS